MLVAGRMDSNASDSDRVFMRVQYDGGFSAAYTDTVSPLFDADTSLRWWQGQIVETHTSGSSAANQFLLAGFYWSFTDQTNNTSQAAAAFPTTLYFVPGTFSNLGGQDNALLFGFGKSTTQYQISDDFVKTRGRNKFGFGANLERSYSTLLAYTMLLEHRVVDGETEAFVQDPHPEDPGRDGAAPSRLFVWAPGNQCAMVISIDIYTSLRPRVSPKGETKPMPEPAGPGGYKRMSLIIGPHLHRAFKAATAARGEQMTDVILAFIRSYVDKYAPKELQLPRSKQK
jgi:hypothetical protein